MDMGREWRELCLATLRTGSESSKLALRQFARAADEEFDNVRRAWVRGYPLSAPHFERTLDEIRASAEFRTDPPLADLPEGFVEPGRWRGWGVDGAVGGSAAQ